MIFDKILALVTALATVDAVFFAWRAAKAARDSVTVAKEAAVAAEQSVTIAQKAWREERAAQRIGQLQRVGEALSGVQSTGDAAVLSGFSSLPAGMTAADAVAMTPVIAVHTAYRRALDELGFALVGVPDALPTCRQLVREQRQPLGTKELLPTASTEVTETLKVAWAELNRLQE